VSVFLGLGHDLVERAHVRGRECLLELRVVVGLRVALGPVLEQVEIVVFLFFDTFLRTAGVAMARPWLVSLWLSQSCPSSPGTF
jgi:hypothetical protein